MSEIPTSEISSISHISTGISSRSGTIQHGRADNMPAGTFTVRLGIGTWLSQPAQQRPKMLSDLSLFVNSDPYVQAY
jgi:hypothetical protein